MAFPTAYVIYFLSACKNAENSYLILMIRKVILGSVFLGQGSGASTGELPMPENEFIMTYVISHYGIAAVVLLTAMLGIFVYWIVKSSLNQKNQLGMIMGLGCGLVFAIQITVYALVNLSLLPTNVVFLPLFTYGGTGTFVSFALIGIWLSVYRYQNILPIEPHKRGSKKYETAV